MENYYYKIKFYIIDHIIVLLLLLYSLLTNNKIFIISNPYGRWGNRLMLFSYMIVWAKQYNAIVLNPSFLEYKKYFSHFSANAVGLNPSKFNQIIRFPKCLTIWLNESFKRISYRSIRCKKVNNFDLAKETLNYDGNKFRKLLSSRRITFFHGFLFGKRNFNYINEQRKELKCLFEFSSNILKESRDIIHSIGKPKIVGVCMRQGDYINHFNGKLYLHDHEYVLLIDRVKKLFGDDFGIFVACE